MKKLLVICFLLIMLCFCSCGSDSDNINPFTIEGITYYNDEPTGDIDIDFGIAKADQEKEITFDSTIRASDSEGKYKFETKLLKGNYQFRIRAKSPVTGTWKSYHQQAALVGQNVTKDFFFWN